MADQPLDRPKSRTPTSSRDEVNNFLDRLAAVPTPVVGTGQRGRLLFALDATASRRPTWDLAMSIQAEMFQEAQALGGLDMQVAFYRGLTEFRATPWLRDPDRLLAAMMKMVCIAGQTQIERVLRHAARQATEQPVNALVFVGDCVEEDVDGLAKAAGEMALRGVPAFLFHEGQDPHAVAAFQDIARLTGGACCRFDPSAPHQLRQLLRAVAAFAAGGKQALEDLSKREGGMALQLTHSLNNGRGR